MQQAKETRTNLAGEWLAGYEGEDKDAHRSYILNSKPLFDQLRKMLLTRHAGKQRVGMADFDSPSWAYKEAYRHGYLEAIEEIAKLLP